MREILFRGKPENSNQWAMGYYYHMAETTYCFAEDYEGKPVPEHHYIMFEQMTDWGLPNQMYQVEVDPATVGQYTGLSDVDGRRIFDGDIVEDYGGGNRYVIRFVDGYFLAYRSMDTLFGQEIDMRRVIGNVFDNPELLEGGTNNG